MSYESIIRRAVDEEQAENRMFGSSEDVMTRASKIASILLNKTISPYDVSIIASCIEMGRLPVNRADPDSFAKVINGFSIGCVLANHIDSVATAAEDNMKAMVNKVNQEIYSRPQQPPTVQPEMAYDDGRAP